MQATASIQILSLISGHLTFIQRRINVDAASWRCIDVNAMLYKGQVPAGYIISTIAYGSKSVEKKYGDTEENKYNHKTAMPRPRISQLLYPITILFVTAPQRLSC